MTSFEFSILLDRRAVPLFPKWLAWVSFACEATFLCVLLMAFLPSSRFAWNGLLTYYVALGGFFIWQILACYHVFPAINRIEKEARLAS